MFVTRSRRKKKKKKKKKNKKKKKEKKKYEVEVENNDRRFCKKEGLRSKIEKGRNQHVVVVFCEKMAET